MPAFIYIPDRHGGNILRQAQATRNCNAKRNKTKHHSDALPPIWCKCAQFCCVKGTVGAATTSTFPLWRQRYQLPQASAYSWTQRLGAAWLSSKAAALASVYGEHKAIRDTYSRQTQHNADVTSMSMCSTNVAEQHTMLKSSIVSIVQVHGLAAPYEKRQQRPTVVWHWNRGSFSVDGVHAKVLCNAQKESTIMECTSPEEPSPKR